MKRKVTIKDIAKELNTTYSTVSRALSGHSRISEETKKAVLKKAKDMGYQPNSFAQKLKTGTSNTIGLVVPKINRFFFSNVIHGVETVAKKNGYNVLICQSNESLQGETESIQTLLKNNVAGIILSLSKESDNEEILKDIIKQKVPLVMFDRVFNGSGLNQVVNDNFKGAYETTEHLILQGYRQIVHLAGPLNIQIYKERTRGYLQALKDYKIEIKKSWLIEGILTRERGKEALEALDRNYIFYDAVFASGDYAALGAMLYLKDKGVNIPSSVGLAGFANEPFTELIGMTSVEQFSTEIGESSASLLLEDVNEQVISEGKSIVINPQLIIRQTTNRLNN